MMRVSNPLCGWLMATMLIGIGVLGNSFPNSHPVIHPFLIYYGWIPILPQYFVRLKNRMSGYSTIVLGSGDEWSSSGDLAPTRRLIAEMPHTRFYGYVDIGVTGHQPDHSLHYGAQALAAWHNLGAQGVLLDCAGPDYGVSPQRLRTLVAFAHHDHLHVLVNSWNPRAALHASLEPGDGWLAENWVIAAGRPVNASLAGEQGAALPILRQHHIAIWMTATDRTVPSATWVAHWAHRTAERVHGSYLAVSGPQYSSRSNHIIPARWLRKLSM